MGVEYNFSVMITVHLTIPQSALPTAPFTQGSLFANQIICSALHKGAFFDMEKSRLVYDYFIN